MSRAFPDTALAADIAAGLARAETLFESQLSSRFPAVNDLCRHVARYRGKMLRPTLVIVSGLAFTEDGDGEGREVVLHRKVAIALAIGKPQDAAGPETTREVAKPSRAVYERVFEIERGSAPPAISSVVR